MSLTDSFSYLSELPKSSRMMFHTTLPYCAYHGWSSPYLARMFFSMAGGSFFSDEEKVPGASRMRPHVSVTTTKTIGTVTIRRRTMKRNIALLLLLGQLVVRHVRHLLIPLRLVVLD